MVATPSGSGDNARVRAYRREQYERNVKRNSAHHSQRSSHNNRGRNSQGNNDPLQ